MSATLPSLARARLSATAPSLAAAACAAALLAGLGSPASASASASASAAEPSPAQPGASAEKEVSNELTLTVWANPEARGPIYARPEASSRRVAHVRLFTPDGFAEVYPVLSSYTDAAGGEWLRVRIPGRPNGRIGWVARNLLGEFHQTRWRIAVSRERRLMKVFYAGRLLRVFPVGVGKPSTPTPPGRFWIDERFKLSNPSSPYWPYALGTSDYSTLPDWPGEGVVGIHGPYGEPQRIPGDPSHGCIRMLAPDIAWLAPRVTMGTPVDIT